jgi:predicted nucleotidyltransferase component of viral defense system
MRISPESLVAEAGATGFRADVLEKAAHLLGLLKAIRSHPLLGGKLALKGGTALNLFVFNVPRLSVDIDLNYVGAQSREAMLEERPGIEEAMQAVFGREDFEVRRVPGEHAGGKWSLRYAAASGQKGGIEVDLNYMYRVPLWPVARRDSRPVGSWKAKEIPVLDIHELAAGKLAALLARRKARDLFDSRLVLSLDGLDQERLRTAFVVYGAMNRKDWRTVAIEDVAFDEAELSSQLLPALKRGTVPSSEVNTFGETMVDECRKALSVLLPLDEAELTFLDLLLGGGEIDATILTSDADLQQRIQTHPNLEWKAQNVRRYMGLDR